MIDYLLSCVKKNTNFYQKTTLKTSIISYFDSIFENPTKGTKTSGISTLPSSF